MRGLIQRVSHAQVEAEGKVVGKIDQGLLVLLGVDKDDDENAVEKLVHKILNYRIFSDSNGKMNDSVLAVNGGILLVSQFTLSADTRKGLRPGFSSAAPPAEAKRLYELCLERIKAAKINPTESRGIQVASGIFGADMQVSLINDGPVTFMLEV